MTWLRPDEWSHACGAPAAGLKDPWRPTGGEGDLAAALAADPRRLAALVGRPGAGASRMALEVARAAPLALYRDPGPPPRPEEELAELAALLAAAPAGPRPVVVLDGPDGGEALELLEALLATPLHPRLLVLVPCNPRTARYLVKVAGDYPRGSVLVAAVNADPTPPALPDGERAEALLPFVLAGRAPAGRIAGEERLVAAGLLRRHEESGTVLCLLGDRARFTLAARALPPHDGLGGAKLAQLLATYPALRRPALEALLRWTEGNVPADFLGPLCELGAAELPALDELRRRAPISQRVVQALAARVEALLPAAAGDPEPTAALEELRAELAGPRERERAEVLLRQALVRPIPPARRGRVLARLASLRHDLPSFEGAARLLREAGEERALARLLDRKLKLLLREDQPDSARAAADELLALEERSGTTASRATARMAAVNVAEALGDRRRALELAELAAADRRAIGDVRGETIALYKVVQLAGDEGDVARVAAAAVAALELEGALGNADGVGTCHYVLGRLAEGRGDPAGAAEHYQAGIEAYQVCGLPPPPRLTESLAAARQTAAAGPRAPAPAGGFAVPQPAPPDEEAAQPPTAEQLVQLRQLARRGKAP